MGSADSDIWDSWAIIWQKSDVVSSDYNMRIRRERHFNMKKRKRIARAFSKNHGS